MAHPQTLNYSILFSCLECLSTFVRYTTTRDMAVAADNVWDMRQRSYLPRQRGQDDSRNTDRRRPQSNHRGRDQTPHTQEFPDGIPTNSRIVQIDAKTAVNGPAPMPVGKRHVLPLGHTAPVEGDRRVPYQIHTATAMSFSHGSGLMFLRGSYNKLNFLVDSRASLSIIPFSSSQTPLGPKLLGANGASIPTWGFQTKTVKIGTNTFEHEFLLAKVAIPILRLDFFRKFQLSIHPLQCQVLDKAGNPISAIFATAAVINQPLQQEVRALHRSDAAPATPTK
jgi:hypothetical protein